VSHLYPNDLYYAHLSLYRLALPLARGADVLDAGCGSGYGSSYLAARGAASVLGIDVDPAAIDFCQRHFEAPNLCFDVLDIRRAAELGERRFDLVFSSNTLEHVPDVRRFLRAAHSLLRPSGVLVVAVPPVTTEHQMLLEMSNAHHLNIWTPAQWLHVVRQYFAAAVLLGHQVARAGPAPDFDNRPGDTTIDETDFAFPALDPLAPAPWTLSVVIEAREPRTAGELPPAREPPSFVDHSFTRPSPLVPPLRPDALDAPSRPVSRLPGRALVLLREDGLRALTIEARRYAWWRARRWQARRALRRWRGPRR
jgi:SAM-dependent methyltransferase